MCFRRRGRVSNLAVKPNRPVAVGAFRDIALWCL